MWTIYGKGTGPKKTKEPLVRCFSEEDMIFNMVAKALTVKNVLPYLKRCGYRGESLKEGYTYYEKNELRQVQAVGFFGAAYNSATACIALIDASEYGPEEISNEVLRYRSLGCPVILACSSDDLQFWHFSGKDAVLDQRIKADKVESFFGKYTSKFSPESIYRAKTIGRAKKSYQLAFVDLGLMPAIEKQEGEYLAGLMVRILTALYESRKKPEMTDAMGKWLFQAAFWLIGAKILKDKQVSGFKTLRISDINSLVSKVQNHYGAADRLDISKPTQRNALEQVAKEIVEPVYSLSHITTESLAYVYENALVSKKTRKALGTHATPSWLVNYIVWQLADWIEEIPQEKRVILEPACGHAPFLTAGAKLLSFLYRGKEEDRHDYLKTHLVGIEKDPFAAEIARLRLTLADIPNKDGWRIRTDDIYEKDLLGDSAREATILLCNPPFQYFSKKEKLENDGIETGNKAAEVLARTLSYMPDGSVFGIVLPQSFLHKKNLANLRKYILDDCELRSICILPDNVFAKAGHPSTVLLGRKRKSRKNVTYIRVPKSELEIFKDSYQAKEIVLAKQDLYKAENYSFRVPELKEIWEYCKGYPVLQSYVTIGRGIEYKNFKTSVRKEQFPGAVKGYGRFEKVVTKKKREQKVDIEITELPDQFWMSLKEEDVKNWRYGYQPGTPQILTNYARGGGGVWRIKGLIDTDGDPANKNFLTIRSSFESSLSLNIVWAIINSPFTNAYMFCNCMERDNLEGVFRKMPVPFESQQPGKLEEMVQEYFTCSEERKQFRFGGNDALEIKMKKQLLAIDAEVLRLYDLPPRLEKQLLDFFAGCQRKGAPFKFDRYYPENFGSTIPLRMFISEEFQNATVDRVGKWVEENRTPEVIKALDNARKAFEED